jgi:hypothetical protein
MAHEPRLVGGGGALVHGGGSLELLHPTGMGHGGSS